MSDPQQETNPGRPRSAWIPWAFVAMFGVIISVNAIMVAFAFGSWTGLETESAFEDGLTYNQQIAAAEAQKNLGWQVDLNVADVGAQRLRVAVDLRDAAGNPFKADELRASFTRPTHQGHDTSAWLKHGDGPGQHVAEVALPLAGIWDLSIEARYRGRSYRLDRRVEVSP